LIGKPKCDRMYPVDPREEKWWLTSEGHVIIEGDEDYDQDKYCMDIFYNKSESDHAFHLFICFDDFTPQEDAVRYVDNIFLNFSNASLFSYIFF